MKKHHEGNDTGLLVEPPIIDAKLALNPEAAKHVDEKIKQRRQELEQKKQRIEEEKRRAEERFEQQRQDIERQEQNIDKERERALMFQENGFNIAKSARLALSCYEGKKCLLIYTTHFVSGDAIALTGQPLKVIRLSV